MSNLENTQNQKSFQYLYEVEKLSQEILTDKERKLELSNARNKYREALRGLDETPQRKTWLQLGSVHIHRPTKECKEILRKELVNADTDLKELDIEIKNKLHKLRDLEHEPRLEGYSLKPLSANEIKGLTKGLGL